MKTSLAIALAVAALTIGTATIALISRHRRRGRGGPDKWCRAAVCPPSADTVRNASWAVSSEGLPAGLNRRSQAGILRSGGPRCGD